VPEDRKTAGGIAAMTVAENLTLPGLRKFVRAGRIERRAQREEVGRVLELLDIRPRDPLRQFRHMSGGNQQKVVLGKWMRLQPRFVIFDEPTQAVDVGAKAEIYRLIESQAADGAAVLVIDSEFEELCRLCDRILLIRAGRIVGELGGAEMTRDRVLERLYVTQEVAA
jgi:ribose transport system ATP-binding protein